MVEGAVWASVSAVIFGVWDWRRRRRGEHCALCDAPRDRSGDRWGGDMLRRSRHRCATGFVAERVGDAPTADTEQKTCLG